MSDDYNQTTENENPSLDNALNNDDADTTPPGTPGTPPGTPGATSTPYQPGEEHEEHIILVKSMK